MLATPNTGLAEPDVFYFGNAIGEAGNQPGNAIVNATDEILARNFPHSDARSGSRSTIPTTTTATARSTGPTRSSPGTTRPTR